MQPRLNNPTPGQHPLPQAPRTSRRSHWSRRRKIAMVLVLLIVCAPLATAGWYVRSITSAIGDAQDVAVVDLPERSEPPNNPTGDQQPANPDKPEAPKNDSGDPSSVDVARGLISAGTGGNETSPEKVWPEKRYLNILVLGVDTRARKEKPTPVARAGEGATTPEADDPGRDQNADTIIIARLDLQERTMNSISLPRDLLVEVPGYGESKINGAYGIGISENPDSRVAGVAKMRDTIEYNFGIPIDDYVLIDFDGFREVVDSIGGIDINVPTRIEDPEFPTEDFGTKLLIIEAGPQHMDGETALDYARTRHIDSDDQRRERQMLVIQSLFAEGQELGTVTRVADLITALSGAAQTNFHWDEQLALASLALKMDQNNINMWHLEQPVIEPGTSATGAWVYVGDRETISAFIESALSGEEPTIDSADASGT